MLKRILIVVMLILTLFIQYAGVPSQGITSTVTFVFNEIPYSPIVLTAPSTSPNIIPLPGDTPALAFTPTQEATPSSLSPAPENTLTPTPEITPTPVDSPPPPTPTPVNSPVPQTPTPEISPTPVDSPIPPLPTPDVTPGAPSPSLVTTPLPGATPEASTPSATGATPTPSAILGPLVDQIPSFDNQSIEAVTFLKDMDAIVNKAVKQSGMRSIYGLFIMDLNTKLFYGFNENLTQFDIVDNVPEGYFNSASVIKLFQGYIFCDMIRRGELDAEKTYHDTVTGRKFKLLNMIKSMISYSDNNYSNACLRIVDNKKSNEVLSRLGIINSRLYGEMSGALGYSRQNNIKIYGTDKRCARLTPLDAALILYNIYMNRDTDPYMKLLNQALLGNVYNTRIPVGVKRVSTKYPIAHKTGTNSALGVYNDAGIVYCKNPFILVAFTQGTTSGIGHSFIRSLAEQLTRYFKD